MKTKTIARICSIQSIYQYIICDHGVSIEQIIKNMIKYDKEENQKEDKYSQMNINFFSEIVKIGVINIKNIDDLIISKLSANWSISSIHLTLLSLLRCGVAELIFFPETPTKVIISEYTNISTMILSEGEENFVNGILDKIAKEVRKKLYETK
jgi:N utilization substance protein B